MKNFKKMVLGLMLLLAVFAFVGCPTPEDPIPAPTPTPEQPAGGNEGTEQKPSTDGNGGKEETPPADGNGGKEETPPADGNGGKEETPPAGGNGGKEETPPAGGNGGEEQKPSAGGNGEGKEEPVVTNNFKGKTFLGMTGEGEEASCVSYIIFTSDKDCEVMFVDEEPILATYTVADDVATLTGTGENAELQLSTTKLTDGKFSITIPPAVSGEEENIVVSYAVGTLWTILYDIPDSDEDFSLKMPEEELEFAVEHFGFVEADYTKDDATRTITLTASGFAKVLAAMGGGEDGDQPADGEYIVMYGGETFESFSTLEEFQAFLSSLSLSDFETDSGDYYFGDDFTAVLTDAGYEKLYGNGDDEEEYIVMYGDETLGTVSSEELEAFLSSLEKSDYSKDDFTVVLTDTEYEKFKKDWKVIIPGNQTSLSYDLIIDQLYKYGLEENTHYAVDLVNRTVTVNDEGFAIMTAPFWKIVNMEGLLQSHAPEFYVRVQIEEAGLIEGEHYTVNYDEYTFKLTETGSEKWNEYSNS